MRLFFSIFLLVLLQTINCFSRNQGNTGFYLDSLPSDGIILNKGWKFYNGDDPIFADPEFDDSDWEPIDPTSNVLDLPPATRSGICWTRLRISTNGDFIKEPLALSIYQNVASEIYINGRLINRFGTISENPDEIIAVNPGINIPNWGKPFAVPIENSIDENLVVAIRFAVQPKINYEFGGASSPLISIRLNSVNAAFEQVRKNERYIPINNTFRVGVFFILAILHLAFFIYNPNQKAYLFFFLYAIFLIPADILQFNFPSEIGSSYSSISMYYTLWNISGLFLMTALYILLGQRRGWIFWVLVLAAIIGLFIWSWVYSIVIANLVSLELVRTALKALKLNIKGAWILAAGAVSYLIFWGAFIVGVYFNLGYWSMPIGEIHILADFLYVIAALSIPVTTTIYIGLDFAFTNHALQEKLGEIEELSKLTIEQEQEKREILASINENLEKQVSDRTHDLQVSLENLQSTQAQLIHAEKMASLGQLTAGIAHEIQNPLNFVNNFSELNKELLEELKEEAGKGNIEEVMAMADDVISNGSKIYHHGKRADAIVKNMLEHSRPSSGEKELTDINALADEYLRLSYHGIRAKDKSFNADFKTDFDPDLPKINVVPQDIGRVLLNIINNAFQACSGKEDLSGFENLTGLQPLVTVTTKNLGNAIEISVKDNGPGIPDAIKDKIFQPFFTTKPTGQGTGLGLSLSYDIVKAHGGEIKVESPPAGRAGEEGKGTEFSILLPI